MRPVHPPPTWHQYYEYGFVAIMTAALLSVLLMSMSGESQQFDEGLFQKRWLIGAFNHIRIHLGDRVFPEVLFGEAGWMEYTGGGNIDDYQHALRFSPAELEATADAIQACRQLTQNRGATFLFVVAPNKASIYPDRVPAQIGQVAEQSRLDQLISYMSANDMPAVLDLRPALKVARQSRELYDRTGTHWNAYGAHIAYTEIVKALSRDYPILRPYPEAFFRIRQRPSQGKEELPGMIEAKFIVEPLLAPTRDVAPLVHARKFPIDNELEAIYSTDDVGLPSLLLVADSFGRRYLNEMLSLNFSRTAAIGRGSAPVFLTKDAVGLFDPDIVVYEVIERGLQRVKTELAGCSLP